MHDEREQTLQHVRRLDCRMPGSPSAQILLQQFGGFCMFDTRSYFLYCQ